MARRPAVTASSSSSLENCQRLIDQAGLAPRACPSATRLLREEYDENRQESEEETSLGDNPSDCPQCDKELKTKKSDWLDSRQALKIGQDRRGYRGRATP